jgi:hypothetical protein
VAGCCECGDDPSGSCATELVSYTCKKKYERGGGGEVESYNSYYVLWK